MGVQAHMVVSPKPVDAKTVPVEGSEPINVVEFSKRRIPVGFVVHMAAIFLLFAYKWALWAICIALSWNEVGNVLSRGVSRRWGLSTKIGGLAVTLFDFVVIEYWPPAARAPAYELWQFLFVRTAVVFLVCLALGLPWKDVFVINFCTIAMFCATILFSRFPVEEFLIQVSLIVSSDTFQFFVGKAFGTIRIVPTVSPNKTLEGYIGGFVLCNSLSLLVAETPLDPKYLAFFNGLLLSGMLGDLSISAWKRFHVVKDTSDVLGSHGGLLDRIDSHLGGVAFTYFTICVRKLPDATSFTNITFDLLVTATAAVWLFVWARFLYQIFLRPILFPTSPKPKDI